VLIFEESLLAAARHLRIHAIVPCLCVGQHECSYSQSRDLPAIQHPRVVVMGRVLDSRLCRTAMMAALHDAGGKMLCCWWMRGCDHDHAFVCKPA
jgi:hypothetical protein